VEGGGVHAKDSSPTRSRENTKTRLLDAAIDVFVEKGLGRASVDDLASAAGFTRGAFYSNYTSKEDLLTDLFTRESHRMVQIAQDALAQIPPAEFVDDSISTILEALRPYGRTFFIIQYEYLLLASREPARADVFAVESSRLPEQISSIITEVLHRLGRRSVIGPLQLAQLIISTYLTQLTREALGAVAEPGTDFITDMLPTMLEYLSEPID
jgi:AcrR family transcriptional regulator